MVGVVGIAAAQFVPSRPHNSLSNTPIPTAKSCAGETTSASTSTCTWSVNPGVGETLYCDVANFSTTTSFSMTDNGSTPNTYTANGAQQTTSTRHYQHFVASVTHAPSTTSVTVVGTASFLSLMCMSVTGGTGASDATVNFNSGGPSINTIVVTTTTSTNGSVIECLGWAQTGTLSAGTGFTLRGAAFTNLAQEFQTTTTAGGYSSAINNSANTTMDITCAAYK